RAQGDGQGHQRRADHDRGQRDQGAGGQDEQGRRQGEEEAENPDGEDAQADPDGYPDHQAADHRDGAFDGGSGEHLPGGGADRAQDGRLATAFEDQEGAEDGDADGGDQPGGQGLQAAQGLEVERGQAAPLAGDLVGDGGHGVRRSGDPELGRHLRGVAPGGDAGQVVVGRRRGCRERGGVHDQFADRFVRREGAEDAADLQLEVLGAAGVVRVQGQSDRVVRVQREALAEFGGDQGDLRVPGHRVEALAGEYAGGFGGRLPVGGRVEGEDVLAVGADAGRDHPYRADRGDARVGRRRRGTGADRRDQAQVGAEPGPRVHPLRLGVRAHEGHHVGTEGDRERAQHQRDPGTGRPAPQPAQRRAEPGRQRPGPFRTGTADQQPQQATDHQQRAAEPQRDRGEQYVEGQGQRLALDRGLLEAPDRDVDGEDDRADGQGDQVQAGAAPTWGPAAFDPLALLDHLGAADGPDQ